MKRLIILLAMLFPLTGCVPAVIVAGTAVGATIGGAIIYDKRSLKTQMHDRDASQTAQNLINHDRKLRDRSHISVATYNHIGLMVGQAQTPALRKRAFQLVSKIKYFRRIYNEVTIAGSTSEVQRANDDLMTGKVKAALLTAKGVHSNQIKVVTENSVVYLMGIVSKKQAKIAANVARRVSGVRKVVMVFQYG